MMVRKIVRKIARIVKKTGEKGILFIINKFYPYLFLQYKDKVMNDIISEISNSTNIVSPLETLMYIEKIINSNSKGAYMRFGDGDAYLAMGINDSFQDSSEVLKLEMKEAFSLFGDGVVKSLSIHSHKYGFEKEMYIGNHLVTDDVANRLLSYTFPYFVGNKIYSPICLHYVATYYPEIANSFLKLLKNKTILFIGNEAIPSNTIEMLFGNITHVKTPSRNSYSKIDEIEHFSIKHLNSLTEYGVVVVAMGCSGRIMMKRLSKLNYNIFLFDFGSLLDGIIGVDSRKWLKDTKIDYEKILKNL